jgi:hypothetical protein
MTNGRTPPGTSPTTWQQWPETFKALKETYFPGASFGLPGEMPANGNYLLAGLKRYADFVRTEHGHHGFSQGVMDRTAAHEVFYVYNRGRKFNRPAAGLSACICNIAIERPERLMERHTRELKALEKKRAPLGSNQE